MPASAKVIRLTRPGGTLVLGISNRENPARFRDPVLFQRLKHGSLQLLCLANISKHALPKIKNVVKTELAEVRQQKNRLILTFKSDGCNNGDVNDSIGEVNYWGRTLITFVLI
jgi:hypothetical protein